MVHCIIAVLIIIFALILICERKAKMSGKQKLEEGYASSRSSKSGHAMPNLAAAIYGDPEKRNNKSVPLPPDSINDVSSGYMNSSYEGVKEESKKKEGMKKSKKKSTNIRNSSRPKSSAVSLINFPPT